MALERSLIHQVRNLDEYDLRRLIIFARGLLIQRGEVVAGLDEPMPEPKKSAVGYRLVPVNCGKSGCTKCPHGPYWYAYWRENGRVKSRYIGRRLPQGVKTGSTPPPAPAR